MTSLYDPIVFGDMKLSNRVFMAPLTRNRGTPNGVPGELASTYYSQRASAGLIVSEATQISAMGKGYINTQASIPRNRSPAGSRSSMQYTVERANVLQRGMWAGSHTAASCRETHPRWRFRSQGTRSDGR